MTLPDMIASFTINGAYANFIENETGSIEVGKKADLVVLERNLFDIPTEEIGEDEARGCSQEGAAPKERARPGRTLLGGWPGSPTRVDQRRTASDPVDAVRGVDSFGRRAGLG